MVMQRLLRQFDVDFLRVRKMVDAFMAAKGLEGEPAFTCVYEATDFSDRKLFKVVLGDALYALKFDGRGGETGRLAAEFATLQHLDAGFEPHEKVAVPKPLYLSPNGDFFVSDYIDFKTCTDIIFHSDNDKAVAQVYRRAGHWLHVLHGLQDITSESFWPNWMIEQLTAAIELSPAASPVDYQPMIAMTRLEAERLTGQSCIKTLCHGDFHGKNLIMGRGVTFGFDVTQVVEKLAVYDIVDFLKGDVYRDATLDEVDQSGIMRAHKDMFFKLYRHPINHTILDFSLRTRLLIDWLSISQARHAKSPFQRDKFDRLQARLDMAFA